MRSRATVQSPAAYRWRQPGAGAVLRSLQSRLRDDLNVTDFGAVGDGVTDDTAAIQAAIDAAAVGSSPTSGNKRVFLPPGVYLISASIEVPDYIHIYGAGRFCTIVKAAALAASFFRSPFGESPTIGQRVTGIDIRHLSIQNDAITAGAIGINFRNGQYCSLQDVLIKNVDIGFCTDQVAQYNNYTKVQVQIANIGAYLEGIGGGNKLTACDIAGKVVALDLNGGAFDLNGGTYEALEATTDYCIRVGRPGGQATYVTGNGCYVEGTDSSIVALQVEDSVIGSAFYNLHRHSSVGTIVNNAGTECSIECRGFFRALAKLQIVQLCNTLDGAEQVHLRSNGTNLFEVRNAANDGYADQGLRSVFVNEGISARGDGNAPNVLRGAEIISGEATSVAVVFASAQAFAGYYIMHGVEGDGTEDPGSHGVFITDKTLAGFTINVDAAPGIAPLRSVTVNWMIVG